MTVVDNGQSVSLVDAMVDVVIKAGTRRIIKRANITDLTRGICEVTLSADDLSSDGLFVVQGIVKYSNGNEFASDTRRFIVGKRI
ncbi:hypothetical protein J2S17_002593 [Cytobacillus purgationiresistens]|uniref:Uncharacterized protein n=1 Tax=Cytobacillus purgationiresistens TaxID=863449 RepID=A0ABU0AJX5_9BACI|nr:hypothetical protein [Cytobacillus purgationiresistens]